MKIMKRERQKQEELREVKEPEEETFESDKKVKSKLSRWGANFEDFRKRLKPYLKAIENTF